VSGGYLHITGASGGAMSERRRLTVAAAAAAAAATAVALVPAVAAATPDQSLQGLVLSGGCPGQAGDLKNLVVAPRTPFLFAPLRLMDQDFGRTGKWLFPYTILITGEGLKTRHLTPGVLYTRPGWAPRAMVTCVFDGATKEDGPFQVTITGPVRGG
jgi:hypothetical protein